jgi:predicted nuclease of restriction endonuclease-like RecB superfamily
MLSPEHVRVRRQGSELKLLALSGELRERALAIARDLAAIAVEHVGRSRAELETAWEALPVAPRERKLRQGLEKLVEDASEFEGGDAEHAAELRREIFGVAAERRRTDAEGAFDRTRVMSDVAERRGMTAAAVEAALYADLRTAQRLVACAAPEPEALVAGYERAQVQAVLLRAVGVVAEVRCASGDAYRALFRQLKFRRLMHRVSPLEGGGYRIEIDGPFSLFQSVAKYGLELALTLPALEACQSLSLRAEIRWSQGSRPLTFRYEPAPSPEAAPTAPARDEVKELADGLRSAGDAWRVAPAERVLDLPGMGVCVPDLALKRVADGAEVLVEVLGFWSRASVWQRVELARRGLGAKVLFVVSSRLRVSEDVLEDEDEAALYVYKGHINPRAVLRHAEALAASPARPSPRRAERLD